MAKSRFKKSIERCPPTGIEDTIAELRTWAAFRDEEKRKPPPVLRHSPNAGLGAAILRTLASRGGN